MSLLGARTKKITTYGRKNKTRIINIHADLTPEDYGTGVASSSPRTPSKPSWTRDFSGLHPTKNDENAAEPADNDDFTVLDSPPRKVKGPSRPPLKTKTSQDVRAPPTPQSPPLKKPTLKALQKKPSGLTLDSGISLSSDDEPVLRKHVVRRRRAVIPRSPSSSPRRDFTPARVRGAHPLRQSHAPTPVRDYAGASRNDLVERLAAVVIPKLDKLSLENAVKPKLASPIKQAFSNPLTELLNICSLRKPVPFASVFTNSCFMACLPGDLEPGAEPIIRKIGEASYSEVFSIRVSPDDTEVVAKIIPLLEGDAKETTPSEYGDDELPDCSHITEVMREIITTRHMGRVPGGGFIDFLGAFVVEGVYPQPLLDEWDSYSDANGSESVRPDNFSSSQKYAFLVLSDGGDDLESYRFEHSKGWVQAAAVFWQVADALARAEKWTQFEHRDLHEGQILVTPVEPTGGLSRGINYLDPEQTAVRASLIDFGLSRLRKDGEPMATPLPVECFDGVGEQWDVYRAMRALIEEQSGDSSADAWDHYFPRTNVLWLNYLVRRLLHFTKTLRKPVVRRARSSTTTKRAPRKDAVRERCDAAYAMLNMVESQLLGGPSTRGKKSAGFGSASDVMAWGRVQGWVA